MAENESVTNNAVLKADSAEYLVKKLVTRIKEADKFAYSEIIDMMNAKHKQTEITLLASGWSDSYPYTQEISNDEISGDETIRVVGIVHPDNATLAQNKAITKASSQLISNETGVSSGKIIFKAIKKPTVDFTVVIEGYDVTTALLSDTATFSDVAELTWADLEGKVWYQIKADKYLIYDANGGYFDDEKTVSRNKIKYDWIDGKNVGSEGVYKEPVNEDLTFLGWYTDTDCTTKADIDAILKSELTDIVTVYAGWKYPNATLLSGKELNVRMKTLAGDSSPTYNSENTTITAIQRSDTEPSEEVKVDANSIVSTSDSDVPVYMWFDNGTIKWWSEAKTIKAGTDLSHLCQYLTKLINISGLADFNTGSVTNMSYGFGSCWCLTDINALLKWNTSAVTNMSYIFTACEKLTNINGCANWKTDSVTNMDSMFFYCHGLTNLDDLVNWNVEMVTDMRSTFADCKNITDLNGLKHWNTKSVTSMYETFARCGSIIDLNGIANWNTKTVTDMSYMFSYCEKLTDASAINDWDIDILNGYFISMFENCPSHPEFTKCTGTWKSNGTFTPTK